MMATSYGQSACICFQYANLTLHAVRMFQEFPKPCI